MKLMKIITRTILIMLAIILIAVVSFVGIYAENKKNMTDVVKEYEFGRDLTGSRRIELSPSDGVTTKNYDSEGNEISSDDTETVVASTEEIPDNTDEAKTAENYQKAKEVMESRLASLGIKDYTIRLNEETGNIMLELPEDSETTDTVISVLTETGKFEIVDADTEEVLLTNDDIQSVTAGIGSTDSGYVAFIGIQFNKEGTEKFEQASRTYTTVEETVNTTDGETTTEEVTKEIELRIDGQTIMTDSFEDPITDGLLQLTVGSASTTSNSEDLQESYTSATAEAAMLNNGVNPIVYTISQNKYVHSDITISTLQIAIYVAIGIAVLAMVVLVIKFKLTGLLGSISLVGFTALLLLAVRYTNVTLSISGLISIALCIGIEYMIIWLMAKKFKEIENGNLAFIKTSTKVLKILLPVLVIAVVFSFSSHLSVFSFGMTLFWGVALEILYNLIVTRTLFIDWKK